MRSVWPSSPAELFGELFHQVQVRRLFPDGKHFVDMPPLLAPRRIMSNYQRLGPLDDRALAAFVAEHFAAPATYLMRPRGGISVPLREHINSTWDLLARECEPEANHSSLLPIVGRYMVPGGRFREPYYWDGYFTLLGLNADARCDLAEAMIEHFTSSIETFGFIPNGARSYYLGRSQPPVYYLMLDLVPPKDLGAEERRLDALMSEYSFWMAGTECLKPGEGSRRVVCMPDGSRLNRYWDEFERPRDESYAEDLATARQAETHPPTLYRNLRAACESGWDFSSRWYCGGSGLGATRVLDIAPIDLNCLLHGLELSIARRALRLSLRGTALRFTHLARNRRHAINAYLWHQGESRFADCYWPTGAPTASINAAGLFPLFTGIASQRQADAMAALVGAQLLAPGGLRTTNVESGEQWDIPNGWAPLQWIAAEGLKRYGLHRLALDIATRWYATVRRDYEEFGLLFEKYDVERQIPGRGGEYPVQVGFGWTNGVVRALLDEVESRAAATGDGCPAAYGTGARV
ncbi:MAG TPA: alpha,alpha-trehalase TreF [Steroidobacteraceae bacterium]|jgi:alpha,alpha-trehalase